MKVFTRSEFDRLPRTEKKPKLKREWEGRYVVTKYPMRNGNHYIAPYTLLKVSENYGGLCLKNIRETCPTCGFQHRIYITKVEEYKVTLLPEDYKPDEQPVQKRRTAVLAFTEATEILRDVYHLTSGELLDAYMQARIYLEPNDELNVVNIKFWPLGATEAVILSHFEEE